MIDRVDLGTGDGVRVPKSPSNFWRSGPVEATLRIDSARKNYVTVMLDKDVPEVDLESIHSPFKGRRSAIVLL